MMEHGNLGVLVEWLNALPGRAGALPAVAAVHRPRAWALAFTGSFEAVTPCLQDVGPGAGRSASGRGLELD